MANRQAFLIHGRHKDFVLAQRPSQEEWTKDVEEVTIDLLENEFDSEWRDGSKRKLIIIGRSNDNDAHFREFESSEQMTEAGYSYANAEYHNSIDECNSALLG